MYLYIVHVRWGFFVGGGGGLSDIFAKLQTK